VSDDDYDDELRVALVLNGGVSLAIWMGGAAYELDRGRRAAFPALPRGEGGVGAWDAVCKALRTRVTIDVISGTSAGGLNGALLGAAIAQRSAMPCLRDTWRSLGDLGSDLLIRKGRADAKDLEQLSVLNGSWFERSIGEVFAELANSERAPRDTKEEDAPSTVALTLTSTALHGFPTTYLDEEAKPFDQREYRMLYRFRREPLVDPEANPTPSDEWKWIDEFPSAEGANVNERVARLAHVARATASFPGAFAPIYSQGASQPAAAETVPDLSDICTPPLADWVMDGGVLDNEPFGPVFTEVRKRSVDRNVRRLLVYLVPATGAADGSGDHQQNEPPPRPGFLTPLLLTTSLPRETNIVNQLAAMRQLLSGVAVEEGTLSRLLHLVATNEQQVEESAAALFPLYRARRYVGALNEFRAQLVEAHPQEISLRPPPDWSRAAGAPLSAAPWVPGALAALEDPNSDAWDWGLAAADDAVRSWIGAVRDALAAKASEALRNAARELTFRQRQLLVIREAIRKQLCELVEDASAEESVLLAEGRNAFAAEDGGDGSVIGRIVRAAATTACDVKGELADVAADLGLDQGPVCAVRRQLLVAVLQGTFSPPTLDGPVPRFRFVRMGLDAPAGIDRDDAIPRVLYGLELKHFGAFLRSSWRLNDWMLGRLDGSSHLAGMLLEEDRLRRLASDDRSASALAAALGRATGAEEDVAARVKAIADAGANGPITTDVQELRRLVTRAVWLDILRAELPHIRDEVKSMPPSPEIAAWADELDDELSDASLEKAFEVYTLGREDAKHVLDTHAGAEGLKDAVNSAGRAVERDETLPAIAHAAAHVAVWGYHRYANFHSARDHASSTLSDFKGWVERTFHHEGQP
jgi:patatin-related protein